MLHDIFSSQLGLVTREQAICAGLTERSVDHHLVNGSWLRVHPRVYRAAVAPSTSEQAQLAAVLACGTGSAVSHRAAAARRGTRVFSSFLVEVSVPGDGRPRLKGTVVHRMGDLQPDDIEILDGIPTTRAERTVIDLGMVVRQPTVERLMEEWLADRVVSVETLRRAIDRHAGNGRRGVGVARRALEARALGDEAGDSTDEHLVAFVLRQYGVPLPVYHHLVERSGQVLAELDYAYVPERLGIELFGYNPHTRTRRAFESFLARQNLMQGEGWMLLGYTPAMLRRRPWAAAREIDDHRRARSALTPPTAGG